ncbi:hypothetical protein L1049_017798 [Liquidambar formosana]|uniref:K Homology domain-containing protein n=1 Tax=Liquidambar formosana TaxID=63359 RepID=A0AAP0N378_LIQFO
MVRAAADDVRFFPYIHHKMMEKLNERFLWQLAVRGALYCRCFCINDNEYADWPPIPSIPANLTVGGNDLRRRSCFVLDVPPGKMGCVIGRRGASILSIKESCNAEIVIGGAKGPPDKVFILGPVKQVRKAEAILRGKILFGEKGWPNIYPGLRRESARLIGSIKPKTVWEMENRMEVSLTLKIQYLECVDEVLFEYSEEDDSSIVKMGARTYEGEEKHES